MDHLKGRDSNSRLQRNINKYGISNFEFVIYYWHTDPYVNLTDIETVVFKSFPRLPPPNPAKGREEGQRTIFIILKKKLILL
jgi:hypothetical protein